MFADSILENSWDQRSRRSWTTLTSFGLQALVLAFLLAIPLIRPVALPFMRPLPTPISMALPGPPPTGPVHSAPTNTNTNMRNNQIIAPPSIPRTVRMFNENEDVAAPQIPTGQYIPGDTGGGGDGGVRYAIGNTTPSMPALPPKPITTRPPRISEMSLGDLVRKVQPTYPTLARNVRVQGSVVLVAIISKEGTIENLRALAGHPMLIPAAIDAVRQWRYRPYILNGEPIEVETQITVNFTLAGN